MIEVRKRHALISESVLDQQAVEVVEVVEEEGDVNG